MAKTRDSAGFRAGSPNEARIVDYWLGGKDNFAADREAAERAIAVAPELPMMARESRKFLGRAVRFLVAQGVRQFVDIGCGLPTQNNAHEIAQAADPESRVVYVDFDPVVITHARALLADEIRTSVVQADIRDPELILGHPDLTRLIDLEKPVGLLLVAMLQAIPEDEAALDILARFRRAISPGSWMVITHAISDSRPEVTEKLAALYQDKEIVKASRRRANLRTYAEIVPYFDELELAEPGIVRVPAWRPELGEASVDPDSVWSIAGVARKP